MPNFLIDTNVCLDLIERREPFKKKALRIFAASETNEFTGIVSAHAFATFFYLTEKHKNTSTAYKVLQTLRQTVSVGARNS